MEQEGRGELRLHICNNSKCYWRGVEYRWVGVPMCPACKKPMPQFRWMENDTFLTAEGVQGYASRMTGIRGRWGR